MNQVKTYISLSLLVTPIFLVATARINGQEQYFQDETSERLPAREDDSVDASFADLDGDNDLDIVVATTSASFYRSYFIINDGAGYFPGDSLQNLFSSNYNFSSVSIGDVERDGDFDLLFSAYLDKIKLLLRMEDGTYTDVSETRLPGHNNALAKDDVFVDVDNDLYLDISIVEYGLDRLWINNGWGYYDFSPYDRFPSGIYNGNAVTWGDVDGDFDLDCVIGNNTGHPNLLMINDGTGWFSDETASRLPEDLGQSNGVVLVDLDMDNDLDVFIANGFFPGNNKIWINDGSGHFMDESQQRIPQDNNVSVGVSFGDIDNDDDIDLLISNFSSGGDANKVLVNNGEGYFTDETGSRYPELFDDTVIIKLGDVDFDGDLDCYIVNIGEDQYGEQNRLLINQSTPDSFPPIIPRTYHHPDTGDTTNPYLITTTVWDNISVVIGELNVSLLYRSVTETTQEMKNVEFLEIPMQDCGGFLYRERIPSQPSGTIVEYYIKAEDRMGNISYDPQNAPDSVFSFLVDSALGIGGDSHSTSFPKAVSLSQNYPNPFNPSTTIDYSVPRGEATLIHLTIYDMRGRLIRTLINEEKNPGSYSVHWDGRDMKNQEVGSGVYIYRIVAGDFLSTRKLVITR